jgi:DNA-directed RNA polymerase specialized sigma24 family protein
VVARVAAIARTHIRGIAASKLYGVALRVVRNREWAEDVLQEAYLNIWRTVPATTAPTEPADGLDGRDRAQPRAGLAAPPHQAERADLMLELDDDHQPTPWPGDTARPHGHHPGQRAGLGAAPVPAQAGPKQREVVSLAYLRDLSHGELAEQLKLPLGTVKTWIRRGLEQLRGCMARFA